MQYDFLSYFLALYVIVNILSLKRYHVFGAKVPRGYYAVTYNYIWKVVPKVFAYSISACQSLLVSRYIIQAKTHK